MSDVLIDKEILEDLLEQHISMMGKTTTIAYMAQQALSRPAPVQVPDGMVLVPGLDADELAALKRCVECWEDDEGHDVEKDMIRRLVGKGALTHRSAGWYNLTTAGRAMLAAAPSAPAAAEKAGAQEPQGRNSFGLDLSYFGSKMGRILRDLGNYKPDEFARECARMAATADEAVLREHEFCKPVAPTVGVDAEKVMGLVEEYGGAMAAIGRTDGKAVERAYAARYKIRALLAAQPAGGGSEARSNPSATRQYFYRDDDCPAEKATDANCICWRDEGTGPFPDGTDIVKLHWRDKTPAIANQEAQE